MMMLRKAIAGTVRSAYILARLAEERLRSGVAWWPLAPGFVANPYPVYRRLRERDPVHYSILTEQVVVTRYADVDRILRDHRNFSNDLHKARSSRGSLATRKKLKPSMLVQDPPDHTRLRGLVNRAFTPRSVANMEDFIRATAHTLLNKVEGHDEFDLMTAYAGPLPTLVIARMIGVPDRDLDRFRVWSNHLVRALEPLLTPEEEEQVYQNEQRLADYHRGIIEQRRRSPRDDLISRLVEAEEHGDKLTLDEVIVMLRLLLIAGNETTTNLIGNGMRALLRNPDQLALLRERPELMPSAVEELLRYDSPVQLDMRFARSDLEIGGRFVRSRTMIAPAIGSANRDPERFQRPDELDITRSDAGNISFGRGIHHCLGAPLARLEGRIALEVLLERFAQIGFGKRPPRYRHSIVLRGLEHFDIRAIPRGCSAEGPTGA
ncbi:MAG: cytochrome P450 [Gemmatimonadetes bacterium]|nr:cytochrome P450 [Gemmatimonadota bacterium]MYB06355.1 cytochrome P450 [Gemmatimonadota bacterium]MYE17829.1 cytochrome P450 [Gemmatimonadota bacterium]MYG23182.1 cytochrome P450 [Gemmatimonadota bacterium]MYJ40056.1 cytochrome P450 [Gemmatimonadota bacterium]